MSDTPRTDTFIAKDHVAWDGMWIDFARKLERENRILRQALVSAANRLHHIGVDIKLALEDAR